jgi:HlyD family secretion protein
MSMNKKTKKNLIIASVTAVLVAGFALGLWFFVQYRADRRTVDVVPMMNVTTQYWGDQTYSSGTAASDSLQEIYPTTDKTISDIYVEEGQQVAVGDPLLQYDKTKLELDVESKDLAVKQAEIELDDAEKQLKKLQNTTPVTTPKPGTPTNQPIVTPKPTATPTPTPTPAPTIKPADVTLYRRLDVDSKPYAGSGTSEDPYVFLCTDDCVMTREFLLRLLGDGSGATPGPDDVLASPFAAIFEVREGDSNYGDLLWSFKLDGTDLSGNFQVSDLLTGSNTLESVEEIFDATSTKATPTPSNDYDDMGYTKDELNAEIEKKRQEIKNLQLKVKQAELDLEKSKLALENSTIRSTVDGVVRTLTDVDTATANNSPLLVVSGQGQFTIKGSISESLLTSVHVGDVVNAMSYESGMSYTATISEISDYPLDANSGGMYGSTGNPNSSQYEFTAVVDDPEGLTNGMYLEITLNVQGNASSDALYLQKAYIREDEAGSYVMKAGIDNRLYKQYLELGATIYSGEYVEIISGLTMDDYIAFPYGPNVQEGVRAVVEGSEDPPHSEEGTGESSAGDSSSTDGSLDAGIAPADGAVMEGEVMVG